MYLKMVLVILEGVALHSLSMLPEVLFQGALHCYDLSSRLRIAALQERGCAVAAVLRMACCEIALHFEACKA